MTGKASAADTSERTSATPVRRKPTINDVAQLAGVSFGTVSRVLNDAPDVSNSTRERVLKVIQDIGYRRNRTATALVTNRSTSIGILSDGSPRFGPAGTLMALENVARKKGYDTTVISVDKPYDSSVQAALDSLDDTGVGGIIVIAPVVEMAAAVRRASCRVPLEMIAAGESSTPNVFTYSENQELGARIATEHLIGLGHTNIAHFAGSMEWFDGRVRKRGWESALRDAGLAPGLCVEGDWTPGWAYQAGLQLVHGGKIPQAIFAASDHTALGLIRAFAENGIRVPQDVSVVGFDDIEGSDYFLPPLTTVRQDFNALALMSTEVLIGTMEGHEVDRTPIAPTLIVRDSAIPAAVRHS